MISGINISGISDLNGQIEIWKDKPDQSASSIIKTISATPDFATSGVAPQYDFISHSPAYTTSALFPSVVAIRESGTYKTTVTPLAGSFFLFNAVPTLESETAGVNTFAPIIYLANPIMLATNVDAGTLGTTIIPTGFSSGPVMRTTGASGAYTVTQYNAYTSAITLNSEASGTVDLLTYNDFITVASLFQGAGTNTLNKRNYINLVDETNADSVNGILSSLSGGSGKFFINHTGTAISEFIGGVNFSRIEASDDICLTNGTCLGNVTSEFVENVTSNQTNVFTEQQIIEANTTLDGLVNLFPSQTDSHGFTGLGPPGFGIIDYSPSLTNTRLGPDLIDIIYRSGSTRINNGSTTTFYAFGTVQAEDTLLTGTGAAMTLALFDNHMTLQTDDTAFKIPTLSQTFNDRHIMVANNVTTINPSLLSYATVSDLKVFQSIGSSGNLDLSVGSSPIEYGLLHQVLLTSQAGGSVTVPTIRVIGALNPTFLGAGTNEVTIMTGLYIDDLTNPQTAYGIQSILSSNVNRSFLQHTGTARSLLGGELRMTSDDPTDGRIVFGASQDAGMFFDGNDMIIDAIVGTPNLNFTDYNGYIFDNNLTVNNELGITGNFTNGNCWTSYTGGIAYATNCSAA